MHPDFIKKLGFCIYKIESKTQIIKNFCLKIYKIVITIFFYRLGIKILLF